MKIGLVGLGKMGGNMVKRLVSGGHELVVYDRNFAAISDIVENGSEPSHTSAASSGSVIACSSIAALAKALASPKVVFLMLPAGDPTESTLHDLCSHLSSGDVVVDGSNSNWKDSQRRAQELRKKEIDFLDCGTSGGLWGRELGYCLMVGGSEAAVERLSPIFTTLAPGPDGWAHVGPAGAGHFTKMVHNGIEYGLMEAYAEGFEILDRSPFDLDLHKISHLWNQGSVVRSWLLELAEKAFEKDRRLENIVGFVDDSGMGRWTVEAAMEQDVPAPILTLALLQRFRSRQTDSFAAKVCAALRNEFGGHAVKKRNG